MNNNTSESTPNQNTNQQYQVPVMQQQPQLQQQYIYAQTPQAMSSMNGQLATQPQQVAYSQVHQVLPGQQQMRPVYYMQQPQQVQPTYVSYIPGQQPIQQQPQMYPQAPAFLDQRCFNLVKAKKGIKRWGKCQIYGSYIWILLNAFSVLSNTFMILTSDSWTEFPVQDQSGQMYTLKLGRGGIIMLSLLKIIANLIFIRWGILAIKTFKPIVKDIHREEMQGIFGDQNQSQQQSSSKSQSIKEYQKQAVKLLIASFVVMFIATLYTRCFFIKTADDFLDQQYKMKESQGGMTQDGFGGAGNPIVTMPYPTEPENKKQHHKKKGQNQNQNYESQPMNLDIDFDSLSEQDAKLLTHQVINWIIFGIFAYSTCLMACFGGCCLFSIKRARKYQKIQEEYTNQMIPGQVSMVTGINGNGFQQLPVGDTSLETEAAQQNYNNVIPRGVVIN